MDKEKWLDFFFFFKQKTAYEIRKGDWSSDVCSSDLTGRVTRSRTPGARAGDAPGAPHRHLGRASRTRGSGPARALRSPRRAPRAARAGDRPTHGALRRGRRDPRDPPAAQGRYNPVHLIAREESDV